MSKKVFKTDDEIINEIANRIKKLRIEKNISQELLSKKTGLSIHTISNIENGKSFTIENLIKIMRVLDIVDRIYNLIPTVENNPYLIALNKKEKSRVSTLKEDTDWKWGDEK